jgi:Zn-dependent M28 family amino/carboxypeptidase
MRSLLLVWHTGEESGLQGSRWFTDHPTVPRDSIVSQVNVDMIALGDPLVDQPKPDPEASCHR